MSQSVTINIPANVVVLLTRDNGPVTELAFDDIAVEFRKDGGSFESKVVDGSSFTEIDHGYYEIMFDAADLDTAGTLLVVVTGSAIDQSGTMVTVVEADETAEDVSLETCILTGHIFDASGDPIQNAAVSARPVGLPSIEQSAAAITDDLVSAITDSSGQFFLKLVRLADVEVFIPIANFRRRIVVPNSATADLFNIPS